MDRLATDGLRHVFSFLDVPTLVRSMRTCKLWHREIDSDREWKWRYTRLGCIIIVKGNPFPFRLSMKELVIERVRWIRQLRRFIEHPSTQESLFIESIWLREALFNERLEALKKSWKLTDLQIFSRMFGTKSYKPLTAFQSNWRWFMLNILADIGVTVRDMDHLNLFHQVLFYVEDQELHYSRDSAFGHRYLIWKALYETCGQKDMVLTENSTDFREVVEKGVMISFTKKEM